MRLSHRRTAAPRLARPARNRVRLRLEELETRNLLSGFAGYAPAQVLKAYGLLAATSSGGAGATIAIVDAYYDSSVATDLGAFSARYHLPPVDGKNGNGTFRQIDLSNRTSSPAGDDWSVETALDVEWAHAVAPKANIVLVEAASDNVNPATGEPTDLVNAVRAAVAAGAEVVSMSWGVPEAPGETSWDSVFNVPGVTFVAASGDSGAGTIWPAVSPYVVSVGGTTLKISSSSTISSETGWGHGTLSDYYGGSGGGFSQYESLPAYQQAAGISAAYTQFNARLGPDVAYDADPNTGFAVINGGSLYVVGGTSAGAPQWAALIATADSARVAGGATPLSSTQTLNVLYGNPTALRDVTQGSTGVYYVTNSQGFLVGEIPVAAGRGYDLVTGLGTPTASIMTDLAQPAGTAVVATASTQTSATTTTGGQGRHGGKSNPVDNPLGGSQPVVVLVAAANPNQTAAPVPSAALAGFTSATFTAPVNAAVLPAASPRTTSAAGHVDGGATLIDGGEDAKNENTPDPAVQPKAKPAPVPLPAPQDEAAPGGPSPTAERAAGACFANAAAVDALLDEGAALPGEPGGPAAEGVDPVAAAAACVLVLQGFWAAPADAQGRSGATTGMRASTPNQKRPDTTNTPAPTPRAHPQP